MRDYDTDIRTRTVTKRETTKHTDYIDWDYDFDDPKHVEGRCGNEERKRNHIEKQKERLKFIEENLGEEEVYASNYGGVPRIWQKVLFVGMVSDWPYWEPRPSVCVKSVHGVTWFDWNSLTGVKTKEERV